MSSPRWVERQACRRWRGDARRFLQGRRDRAAGAFNRDHPGVVPSPHILLVVDGADAGERAALGETGPPALSPPTWTSEKIACVVTRVTAPSLTSLPPNIEAVIAVTVSL